MGIYEGVSAANDLITGAISVAATRREYIFKQVINSALLLLVLMVFGCLDFATLSFHLDYLLTPSYWGTVGTKVIAGVSAFNIGINLMMDGEIKKNRVLEDLIRRYDELRAKKQIDFEWYVTRVFNVGEKRKAYISHINKRIYWANRFSRRSSKLLYSSDLPENQEKKKKNYYCRVRSELEAMKTDEFINKNLDSLNVRYYEVDPSLFELEIDGAPTISGVKTKGNVNLGRVKASSNMILGMILFSMFVTAFSLGADKQEFIDNMDAFWHYFLKAVEDTFVILWQTLQGMLKTRKIVSQQLTEPYAGRVKVLENYLEWRLTNKIPDTKVYEEMKEEVVEVTQEQFEQLKSGQ